MSAIAPLVAPFPYFGGKSRAAGLIWSLLGGVENYVEPFCGSAAVLLARPDAPRIETINDADGFVANFWRAVAREPEAVAHHADWPCNEADLFARHGWLVRQRERLRAGLECPDFYDAKIAGWWVWGACNWIGSGWCGGDGPWIWDGERLVDRRKLPHLGDAGMGINRQLPHLGNAGKGINRKLPHLGDAGKGINRKLPHLGDAGKGINRKLPHLGDAGKDRRAFIAGWFNALYDRLRHVRVACGDWRRVVAESVTVRHGETGILFDPPYASGEMDYGAGGMGLGIAEEVRAWCAKNGADRRLRIVLCGHAGEHAALCAAGWTEHRWTARKGYAATDEARANSLGETVWASPHCVSAHSMQPNLL